MAKAIGTKPNQIPVNGYLGDLAYRDFTSLNLGLVRSDYSNLVTNGDFATDTDWTKGTGWTIGSGVASSDGTQTSTQNLTQPSAIGRFPVGTHYSLTYTITAISAGLITSVGIAGASDGTDRSSTGTYSFGATSLNSSGSVNISANLDFVGSVDNFIVYEADPSDDAPWLRLPYGYTVGRYGMIVRDGVVLHPSDYTEITNSGQTFIKPIVAPGVSTEFSVWGMPS